MKVFGGSDGLSECKLETLLVGQQGWSLKLDALQSKFTSVFPECFRAVPSKAL